MRSAAMQSLAGHRYENNNNSTSDTEGWVMGDSPSNQPELVTTYR
jgi:hypothetical protein